MFLRGDVAPGSGKDPRRQAVAAKWCVLALMGDQLGDFNDAFNAKTLSVQDRRALAQSPALAAKWGAGWFLLPNPVYGPGIAGTLDDLFPADKRWPGPGGGR
jgi:predicted secreted acid phosphatase